MAGDITRFTFHALGFFTSETIKAMDNDEIGQYVLLMCESILLGKECSLPDDRKYLARAARTTVGRLSETVISEYPVVMTEFGPRRRNRKLYEEWLRISDKTEVARESAERRWKKGQTASSETKQESSLESTNRPSERIANAVPSNGVRNANRTEEHNTEQDRTEQRGSIHQAFDEMDAENSGIVENQGGRQKGEPGFFVRGQYPGTSAKAIWKHAANAWSRIRGDGAVCRYPTKHPSAKTDAWEDLCDTKSGDLIIPAFELWIVKHGQHMETQYPLGEFLKGTNVSEFLSQVSPLNQVRPKLSAETIAATNEIARQQHAAAYGDGAKPAEIEPDANAFLEEK